MFGHDEELQVRLEREVIEARILIMTGKNRASGFFHGVFDATFQAVRTIQPAQERTSAQSLLSARIMRLRIGRPAPGDVAQKQVRVSKLTMSGSVPAELRSLNPSQSCGAFLMKMQAPTAPR
jgi:hypothetical protein